MESDTNQLAQPPMQLIIASPISFRGQARRRASPAFPGAVCSRRRLASRPALAVCLDGEAKLEALLTRRAKAGAFAYYDLLAPTIPAARANCPDRRPGAGPLGPSACLHAGLPPQVDRS